MVRLAALFLLLVAMAGAGFAADEAKAASSDGATDIEERRARWARLSEDERRTLLLRFEQLRELDPSEQQALKARARRLKAMERRVRRSLPDPLREEMERMAPSERKRAWQKLLREHARERGQRVRDMLPADLMARLESAAPLQRTKIVREFLLDQREQHSDKLIRFLGRQLDLSPRDIVRMQRLEGARRMEALQGLWRKRIVRGVQEQGLPAEVSPAEWKRWRSLPDEEFFEKLQETDLRPPFGRRKASERPGGRRRWRR